jgi:hypothetical protein
MYVYTYVHTCTCTQAYVHVHKYILEVYQKTHTQICVYNNLIKLAMSSPFATHTYIYIHVYKRILIDKYIHIYRHTDKCIYTCVNIHISISTYK